MLSGRLRATAALVGLVLGAIVLPLAGAANAGGADPCSGFVGPNDLGVTGFVVAIGDGTAGSTTVYLDNRDLASDDFLFSTWVYLESNNADGLQRGGSNAIGDTIPFLSGTDDCVESATPDTAVF